MCLFTSDRAQADPPLSDLHPSFVVLEPIEKPAPHIDCLLRNPTIVLSHAPAIMHDCMSELTSPVNLREQGRWRLALAETDILPYATHKI